MSTGAANESAPERTRQALLALCRRAEGPADEARVVETTRDPARLAALLAAARALRVLGLVVARLEHERPLDGLEAEAGAELRAVRSDVRRRAAAQELERDRVLARLRRAGVDAVLLKGAALRCTLYREPAEREMSDLDLLVEDAAITPASAALAEAGYTGPSDTERALYRAHHFHFRFQHPLGHAVELHWALTEPDSPARLDAGAFLRESRVVHRRGAPAVRVPCPEHALLHVAAQASVAGAASLRGVIDVDRIVAATPELEWDRLEGAARRGGLATPLALVLALASALLGTPVPGDVARRMRPTRVVSRHLELLRPAATLLRPEARPDAVVRLSQLWLLAGDHGLAGAWSWLAAQGFLGLRYRERLPDGASNRPGLRRLASSFPLVARQLALYAAAAARVWTPRDRV